MQNRYIREARVEFWSELAKQFRDAIVDHLIDGVKILVAFFHDSTSLCAIIDMIFNSTGRFVYLHAG